MTDKRRTPRDRYLALFSDSRPSERVQFFSDAVFAIAMTLLVLDIRLPDVENDQVGDALGDLAPQYLAYGLSFAVIAVTWMAHHRRFEIIEKVDSRLIRLNLLLLFVVAFLPFPTSVLSEHASAVPAVVLYAGTVSAMRVIQMVIWIYTTRAGLLTMPIDRGTYRHGVRLDLADLAVFAASIVIALLGHPTAATYSWLLLIVAPRIVERLPVTRKDDLEPLITPSSR